jgi:hypothetical protein
MKTLRYCNRAEASEHLLTRHGLRRSPKYLAKLSSTGKGPAYHKANRAVLYNPADLDAWAKRIIGPSVHSGIEHPLAAPANSV